MPTKSTLHRWARAAWIATHGDGPWPCGSCDELVSKIGRRAGQGGVHHRDHDPSNNEIENLIILHVRCHMIEHNCAARLPHDGSHRVGKKLSDETRRRIGDAVRGKTLGRVRPQEERDRISASNQIAQRRRRDRDGYTRNKKGQFIKC